MCTSDSPFQLSPLNFCLLCAQPRKMEVQSGLQPPEPSPLSSPCLGPNQQNELEDGQAEASGRPFADSHSKETQSTSKNDDKKVSRSVRLCVCRRCVCTVREGVAARVCVTNDEVLDYLVSVSGPSAFTGLCFGVKPCWNGV